MSTAAPILDAVVAQLTGRTDAQTKVYRALAVPVDQSQLPIIDVRHGGDKCEPFASGHVRRNLLINIRVITSGATAEARAIEIMSQAHAALMADKSLGDTADSLREDDGDTDIDDANGLNVIYTKRYVVDYLTPEGIL